MKDLLKKALRKNEGLFGNFSKKNFNFFLSKNVPPIYLNMKVLVANSLICPQSPPSIGLMQYFFSEGFH